jgi:capsular exopolysaccharide synthesis family protein
LADQIPFVAVVPELNQGALLDAAAARCVHDLRVRLQPPSATEPRTYLITSASSGEGKSSLAAALALSFSAAGFRTLLVDCDLTSRRLSAGFDAADLPGVMEATGDAEPSILRVRSGLSIMAAGKCRPHDACRLAPTATARLFTTIRDRFDVVLIDSDPILTGITASVLAPQVDGVIMTLARGQEHTLVHSATKHLRMLGANLIGAVFNRADASEFRAVVSQQAPSQGKPRMLPERLHRFGPLVASMLSSLALTREVDLDLMAPGMSLARTDEVPTIAKADESKRDVA